MEINNIQIKKKNNSHLFSPLSIDKLSYESADYVMYNYDFRNAKYAFMSPAIVNLTGYNIHEINEIGFTKIVREVIEDKVDRYKINGGRNLIVEEFFAKYYIETKAGEHKWIEDNSFAYIDEEGNRTNSIGILRDTSALQNFINGLNNEKDGLDRIFDLADTMMVQLDKYLNIMMINRKGCKILGGTKDELIGKNLEDFIPVKVKSKYENFVQELLANPDIVTRSTEGTIKSLDDKLKILEWHNTVLRNKNNELVSIISTAQEVTERRNEQKIREIISEILEAANTEKNLEEYFKFIHRSISKLMVTDNFYIAFFNREKNLLTFPYFIDKYDDDDSPKEFGKGLTEYVIRTGRSTLVNPEQHDELNARGETELIGPPSEIWLGVPLKIKDKIIGAIVVQDYENRNTYGETERQILDVVAFPISRAIERKIVEKERELLIVKLKELNKSKDQLFSLISHDLRSPFNSLLGFADILTSEFDTLTREEMREYLNVINESAKNLYGMTNNLLYYSRYQLGKYQYDPVRLNLYKSVQAILETLKNNIMKKNILVKNNVDKNVDITADEDLLNITMENIFHNAIKYTNDGGTIIISTKNIGTISNQSPWINLVVVDDGIGISKANLERVKKREMFSTPGTMKEFGTGLGLLLCNDLCVLNKAEFNIESKEGEGTKVTIQLPLAN